MSRMRNAERAMAAMVYPQQPFHRMKDGYGTIAGGLLAATVNLFGSVLGARQQEMAQVELSAQQERIARSTNLTAMKIEQEKLKLQADSAKYLPLKVVAVIAIGVVGLEALKVATQPVVVRKRRKVASKSKAKAKSAAQMAAQAPKERTL